MGIMLQCFYSIVYELIQEVCHEHCRGLKCCFHIRYQ